VAGGAWCCSAIAAGSAAVGWRRTLGPAALHRSSFFFAGGSGGMAFWFRARRDPGVCGWWKRVVTGLAALRLGAYRRRAGADERTTVAVNRRLLLQP